MSVLCIVNSSESNVPAYWTDHSRTPMWFARWIIIWIHCHHQSPLFGQIKETPCKPAMHGHTQWTGRVVHAFCHNSPINGSTRKGFWRLKFRATKSSRGVMDGDGVLVYKFYKLRSLLRSSEVAPQWDPRPPQSKTCTHSEDHCAEPETLNVHLHIAKDTNNILSSITRPELWPSDQWPKIANPTKSGGLTSVLTAACAASASKHVCSAKSLP